jgi:DNA-binding transcriptional LysR family regulator
MLNVNRMRILREVAARGSIAGAAEALYLSPPAVSQQMATLEREAGVELLERVGRGVRLTPAGERLVEYADRVLAVLEEAQADVDAVAHGVAGRVFTSAFPTAARALLVPALARLRQDYPRLQLKMVDLEPEDSLPLLRVGDLDILITYEFEIMPESLGQGMERVPLMSEPMAIALPVSHPKASGPVSIADLKDDQWVVGRDGSPFLEVQKHVAHQAGFEPHVDYHSNDFQVILAAVEAGLGVALVPPMGRFAEYPGVAFRQPADIQVRRQISAVIRSGSGSSPAVAAALNAIRGVARERAAASPFAGVTAY